MENIQQQLGRRNTYTPIDTSLVYGSVSLSLNKEETLSEQTLKTLPNNLEENLRSGRTEQNSRVFVLNMRGKILMPTNPRKARILVREGQAKVVSCKPFTIQLTQATGESKQEINLGIDAGSRFIGFSATTKKQELICGEFELRQDVSKKLTERAMYRRGRRNKLWYRQPRFNNRTSSKKKGWLAPSIKHKLDTHIRLIEKIKNLLPISRVIVEVAKFDTQKLQNVDIEDVEYQQGLMQGYDNLRAFILQRDSYTCQICKKQEGIFDIHHIIQRKNGGSNRPDNLVTLHKKCHKDFHSGKIKHKFTKPKSFKETSIMNNVWSRVVDILKADKTFGYITKKKRLDFGLEKTHYNDAFIISSGEQQNRCKPFLSKQIRRNNRCLQKNRNGFKPSIRKQRYDIQPNDIVILENGKYIVKGIFNKGKWIRLLNDIGKTINSNIQNVRLLRYGKTIF